MPDMAVVLTNGELLHEYACRVTRERDDAVRELAKIAAGLNPAYVPQHLAPPPVRVTESPVEIVRASTPERAERDQLWRVCEKLKSDTMRLEAIIVQRARERDEALDLLRTVSRGERLSPALGTFVDIQLPMQVWLAIRKLVEALEGRDA